MVLPPPPTPSEEKYHPGPRWMLQLYLKTLQPPPFSPGKIPPWAWVGAATQLGDGSTPTPIPPPARKKTTLALDGCCNSIFEDTPTPHPHQRGKRPPWAWMDAPLSLKTFLPLHKISYKKPLDVCTSSIDPGTSYIPPILDPLKTIDLKKYLSSVFTGPPSNKENVDLDLKYIYCEFVLLPFPSLFSYHGSVPPNWSHSRE